MASRGLSVALLIGLGSCSSPAQIEPSVGRGQGGERVWIHGDDFAGHGGVVVTFADIPARAVVIESDRLIRVDTPAVPAELRGQPLAIVLTFADGESRELDSRYVFEVGGIDVHPRE